MTLAAIKKYEPSADGFFELAPIAGRQPRHLAVIAPRDFYDPGVYALSRADAADLNGYTEMPEQPNYDWSDFKDPDEDL